MHNFPKFPTGKERKENVAKARAETDKFAAMRGEHSPWPIIDSGLDQNTPTSRYPMSGSFMSVIPEGYKTLRSYIEETLAEKQGEAIGVEFGGTGSALFSEFTLGFFRKTVGVSLIDHRQKLDSRLAEVDLERNHFVLEADLLQPETYTKLDEFLDGKGTDLILERMYGGLNHLPDEPVMLADTLHRWYLCLNEGGILLAQVPRQFNDILPLWVQAVREEYPDTLEVETVRRALRLVKRKGAPKAIPLFPAKDVKKNVNRF